MPKSYAQVLTELESLGIMPERAPSLEPMKEAIRRLALSIDPSQVVIVAGTNGKGSVCATLETLLISAGERVGLYTSPHLIETTERIRIAGRDISQEDFCKAYEGVQKRIGDLNLSHFEMLTAMAAYAFFSKPGTLDRAIFEVGLGGVWDATNAIPHSWAIITQLGGDHQNMLGSSLVEIAKNKFGVIGDGMTVVHQSLPSEVQGLADQVRAQTRSRWVEATSFSFDPRPARAPGIEPEFWIKTPWGESGIALPGMRGAQNTATALTAFRELGHEPSKHLSALSRVSWPGRMERIRWASAPCPIYLSGDHNPPGVQSLLELLSFYRWRKLHLLVGVGKDKDLDGILGPMSAIAECSLYLTETPFRGRRLSEYDRYSERAEFSEADPWIALNRIAAIAQPKDLILVTGSLYLVGFLRENLLKPGES